MKVNEFKYYGSKVWIELVTDSELKLWIRTKNGERTGLWPTRTEIAELTEALQEVLDEWPIGPKFKVGDLVRPLTGLTYFKVTKIGPEVGGFEAVTPIGNSRRGDEKNYKLVTWGES